MSAKILLVSLAFAFPVSAQDVTRLWADFDGDGRIDLFRAAPGFEDVLLRGVGSGFVDVTSEAGLAGLASARALAHDLDRDGDPDLLLVGRDGSVRVLHGELGSFLPATPPELSLRDDVLDARLLAEDVLLTARSGERFLLASGTTVRSVAVAGGASDETSRSSAAPPSVPAILSVEPLHEGPCAATVKDQSAVPCLSASSVPTLGELHPLSQALFVAISGRVGLDTLAPVEDLDVRGSASFVGDATAAAATGRYAAGSTSEGALGVVGSNDWQGHASADWPSFEIGLAGVALDGTAGDNVGLLGHSNGAGVRGENVELPSTDYAELGRSGTGVVASGLAWAAELLGDVAVRSASRLELFDSTTQSVLRLDTSGGGLLSMDNEAGWTTVDLDSSFSTGDAGFLEFRASGISQRAFFSGGGVDDAGALALDSSVPTASVVLDADVFGDGYLFVMSSEGLDEETVWLHHSGDSGALFVLDESDTGVDNGVYLSATDSGFGGNLQVADQSLFGMIFEAESSGAAELKLHETDGSFALRFQGDDLTLYDSAGFATIHFDRQTGTKSAVVDAGAHGRRLLYAIEAPEAWFEDLGAGELQGGVARVDLDPLFLETVVVSDEHPLVVQVAPAGPSGALWVETGTDHFVVHDAGGGSAPFHWRVAAKRRGMEGVRLPRLEESQERTGLDPERLEAGPAPLDGANGPPIGANGS